MVTKDEVLSEIRRLAAENGGQTPGRRRFDAETGIRESDWLGRYWARWNDAVAEAGLRPNFLTEARLSDEELVKSVADLTRELGHFPTVAEHRLRRQLGADYPNSSVIQRRLGSRQALLRHLVDFAASHPGYEAVAACCVPLLATEVPEEATDTRDTPRLRLPDPNGPMAQNRLLERHPATTGRDPLDAAGPGTPCPHRSKQTTLMGSSSTGTGASLVREVKASGSS